MAAMSHAFTEHGDEPDVRSVVYNCAIAIATEVTILDPACLILGGVTEMQDFPFDYLEKGIRENLRIQTHVIRYGSFCCPAMKSRCGGARIHAKQLQSK